MLAFCNEKISRLKTLPLPYNKRGSRELREGEVGKELKILVGVMETIMVRVRVW